MTQLGSTPETDGTNFALYSGIAEGVELCFFDAAGQQTHTQFLSNCDKGIWHDFVPGCHAGQRYGYRVHGPFAAERGLRCNPAKLLIDPYARQIERDFVWHEAVFDSKPGEGRKRTIDTRDSGISDHAFHGRRPFFTNAMCAVIRCNTPGFVKPSVESSPACETPRY